jgi:LPXTG-motif cell wall-anchored protein
LALNSTPRRRFGVALGVVLTGVTAGLIGFAGIASAHTKDIDAYCKGDTTTFSVNLQNYSRKKENQITISDNGKEIVNEGFKGEFVRQFTASATEKHTFKIDVEASDGNQYSVHDKKTVEACLIAPPTQPTSSSTTTTTTTVTVPPSTETTTTTTEAAPVVATSTTTPPPAAQGGPLANTGASIALPLGIAGVLLAGGVVMLFVVRRRSSKA